MRSYSVIGFIYSAVVAAPTASAACFAICDAGPAALVALDRDCAFIAPCVQVERLSHLRSPMR